MRIVIDDAGDIPADVAAEYNIAIVPVNIMFGTEEFLSGEQMNHQQFYEKVKTIDSSNFPKTSQPTPYQFTKALEGMIAAGETELYVITVGEKLSGTFASATAAQKELADRATIHVFNSTGATAIMGFMAVEAARMVRAGANAAAITARLTKMRAEMVVYFMIDTLEFAVRGGHVGALRGTVASLLNIKPIMQLVDGEVVEAGRVRTPKKARDHIVRVVHEAVGNRPVRLAAIHANAPALGAEVLEKATAVFNVRESMIVDMTIPVAINLGPGALGLVAIPILDEG